MLEIVPTIISKQQSHSFQALYWLNRQTTHIHPPSVLSADNVLLPANKKKIRRMTTNNTNGYRTSPKFTQNTIKRNENNWNKDLQTNTTKIDLLCTNRWRKSIQTRNFTDLARQHPKHGSQINWYNSCGKIASTSVSLRENKMKEKLRHLFQTNNSIPSMGHATCHWQNTNNHHLHIH